MSDFTAHFQHFARQNALSPDPVQDNAVALLNTIAQDLQSSAGKSWFRKPRPTKGAYLWGGVGRGKTMIMDVFFDFLPITEKRRVHFNIFMLDVHNSIRLLREDGHGKDPLIRIAKDIAENCRVLCFDEFQVYDIADAMILGPLFEHLFIEGVTVICTSNVEPENLYKSGLQRARFLPFIDVLKAHLHICHLDSPIDYRQQALRENGVYFIRQREAMDALFDKITSPHKPMHESLTIKGRTMMIDKFAQGCAWMTFAELCEKPRGAVDYKTLANHVQTVFIDQVPRLGYDRRNEAKRFIILIDTLYDAHINVVINADAAPQDLYNGKDHAFEFDRTVSRLLEMQGEDYISKSVSVKKVS